MSVCLSIYSFVYHLLSFVVDSVGFWGVGLDWIGLDRIRLDSTRLGSAEHGSIWVSNVTTGNRASVSTYVDMKEIKEREENTKDTI